MNGRVTTPTVKAPVSRAILAITGAAPVPVPPPLPAGNKDHIRHPLSEVLQLFCWTPPSATLFDQTFWNEKPRPLKPQD